MTDARLMPPVPVIDPDSVGYWESLTRGSLGICRCTACRAWMHPPLEVCRHCGASTVVESVSGRGSVFSFIVVRRAMVPGFPTPYVIAIVELDEQEGLRLSGILMADPADVVIGLTVQVSIGKIGQSGILGPSFVPVAK